MSQYKIKTRSMLTIEGDIGKRTFIKSLRMNLTNLLLRPTMHVSYSPPTKQEIAETFAREAELYLKSKYPEEYKLLLQDKLRGSNENY